MLRIVAASGFGVSARGGSGCDGGGVVPGGSMASLRIALMSLMVSITIWASFNARLVIVTKVLIISVDSITSSLFH
jgi:hypothetical protein